MLHSMAQKGVEVMFAHEPMICRRASADGSQQVRPQCFHLGKTKAGHKASSFLEILELVNRKGVSHGFRTLLCHRACQRTDVSCVV